MSSPDYHLFMSYARLDDRIPVDSKGRGWISAFHDQLIERHERITGKKLKIFFDTDSIEEMADWRAQLGRGLRNSRIFLAFVSPNYIRSQNCRWEWIEYLRREHTLARATMVSLRSIL
ncbi:MAG: toll/interleukin-1 receptor domain-containing protein [Verrucomicrobiales bacterium]|nr:toll/interleukin-1 receptor domain-containing protein [Verrucomicrobiales bacterium]